MSSIEIVCRFCLRHHSRMWSLKALYEKQHSFLEKVYQCAQINIIDVDELRTWVCYSCYRNIQRFCAFREMLRGNQNEFSQRFQEEQLEQKNVVCSTNHQQIHVAYDFLGELDNCWESDGNDWWDTGERFTETCRTNEDSGFNDHPSQKTTVSLENCYGTLGSEMVKCESCQYRYPLCATDSSVETIEDHICIEYC
ncbi:uncharacterized protein LOC131682721 [Topomyia yanbarensis]|uniref:uncharacterized protein LOC131682721 n=1 Tax=Topomyia yanbarensis TaxID=2498891 RepID=UPI00273ADF7E|nr:uncharacterized protein LOC131682721 [Topomyia yanbarensis]